MHVYQADDIRENLKAAMEKHKISMNAWATRAGITEGTLRNFIAGRSNSLQLGNAIELAAALDIPLLDIIYGENSPHHRGLGYSGASGEQQARNSADLKTSYIQSAIRIAAESLTDRDLPIDPDRLSFMAAKLINRYPEPELLESRGPGYADSFFDY